MRFVTKVCVVSPCYQEAENLPRFGLVSPCEAERRRVRVVPIIGGESGDKELYRLGAYPIVVFTCFRSKG